MKSIITFLSCLIWACPAPDTPPINAMEKAAPVSSFAYLETAAGEQHRHVKVKPFDGKSRSGNYLAAQYAQKQHDWDKALGHMEKVLAHGPDDRQMLSKAMVLAMGAGEHEKAISLAKAVSAADSSNTLAQLFLATEAFHKQDYEEALNHINLMQEGSLSDFMMPLLISWAKAGIGELDTQDLNKNTIHIYHAILIANHLGKHGEIEKLLEASLTAQGLTPEDVEKIADVYAHIGKTDLALELYKKSLKQWPQSKTLQDKVEKLESGQTSNIFGAVDTPEQGIAEALYDMALLLYREHSDESARVFAHMALYLDPNLANSRLLMAHIASRHQQHEQAISYYRSINSESDSYKESRRLAANLLEDDERHEEALRELEILFQEHQDLEALIQIGDIYRRNKEFEKAILTYNQAQEQLGHDIPLDFWHLHYVRGMSYEQNGQWEKAETDLKAALSFKPDHPLVLNYLGYAWADQGVNLNQSLELIRKAVAAEPQDGYIIDSLGWVLFRMGRYQEAVPHLEKAVELLPYDPVINDHLGDAYWQVGRKREARFQWTRAKNHTEDQELILTIATKMESGLQKIEVVEEARSHTEKEDSIIESIIEH